MPQATSTYPRRAVTHTALRAALSRGAVAKATPTSPFYCQDAELLVETLNPTGQRLRAHQRLATASRSHPLMLTASLSSHSSLKTSRFGGHSTGSMRRGEIWARA